MKLFLITLLHIYVTTVKSDLVTYFMDSYCDMTIDMSYSDAALLRLTPASYYNEDTACTVTVKTDVDKRFLFRFRSMDIYQTPGCLNDYMSLYDGQTTSSPKVADFPDRLCGSNAPSGVHTNAGRYLTLQFNSGSSSGNMNTGFEMLLTKSHTGPCDTDEYQCPNSYCISDDLTCDGYRHCGDFDDSCWWTEPTVATFTSGVSSILSLLAFITACCACCRTRKRSQIGSYQPLRSTYEPQGLYQQVAPPSYGAMPQFQAATHPSTTTKNSPNT
ncbi:hypothetical protein ScPMuIL_001470 [Solemya velum]